MLEPKTSVEAESGREFFDRNLAAIRKWAPHLYSRLSAIKSPQTELLLDEDGGIDIGFRGRRLYGRDAVAVANEQVEHFIRAPSREFICEPDPSAMSGVSGTFCAALVRRMAEEGIVYDPKKSVPECHFLLFFGVALGLHLETVIEETKARFIFLIEPHMEFIYQSLFVTNWVGLFERGEARGVRFTFIVDRSPNEIADRIVQMMRGNSPVLIDGITYFSSYPSPILDRAIELFRKELFTAVAGLGYFEDEVVMARNGARNLAAGPAEILSDYLPPREEPVFVVGSGPSVEEDLDFIVANADRAVIMSIGTGLRGLLDRGIYPDLHVELENSPIKADMVAATANDFDFKDVILVGSVTVDPKMTTYFKRAIFFFREGVSATQLFGGPFQVIRPAGPTVANSGLVSAIRLGFRDIYLFGVDMGTKVQGKFHSSGSDYGAGLREDVIKPSLVFPANFGGSATGSYFFDWSRKVLENTIRYFREVRVYNCSNGVRIEGAIPKVSRAIDLKGGPIDRAMFLDDISRGLTRCPPELWSKLWREADVREKVKTILKRFDEVHPGLADNEKSTIEWMRDLCDALDALRTDSVPNWAILGGTLQLIVGYASWYDRRIIDSEHRPAYRRIVAEEFRDVIDFLREGTDRLYDEIETTLRGEYVEDSPAKA